MQLKEELAKKSKRKRERAKESEKEQERERKRTKENERENERKQHFGREKKTWRQPNKSGHSRLTNQTKSVYLLKPLNCKVRRAGKKAWSTPKMTGGRFLENRNEAEIANVSNTVSQSAAVQIWCARVV